MRITENLNRELETWSDDEVEAKRRRPIFSPNLKKFDLLRHMQNILGPCTQQSGLKVNVFCHQAKENLNYSKKIRAEAPIEKV
ncbi:hypothetical protein AVEN_114966-1 [Araneus ventricosus]|uniref:Uncharacterized protein n=1 Tax=Araneus ventricosus TaxID=182803 RepID=A0A4Y2D9U2_ARAVE|nr:hypothetical protein AVEN_114966-1 [Araneus ventricosus]